MFLTNWFLWFFKAYLSRFQNCFFFLAHIFGLDFFTFTYQNSCDVFPHFSVSQPLSVFILQTFFYFWFFLCFFSSLFYDFVKGKTIIYRIYYAWHCHLHDKVGKCLFIWNIKQYSNSGYFDWQYKLMQNMIRLTHKINDQPRFVSAWTVIE